MRVFIAGIATETNTFVSIPTTLEDFKDFEMYHGDATANRDRAVYGQLLAEWRDQAEAEGNSVIEGLCTGAEAGGPVVQAAYEQMRDEIVARVKEAGHVDIVLLSLHGAMVASGCDDCEGELLALIREQVGPECVIGAELDLHCHVTQQMLACANALIAYKEYPHTDAQLRARELYRLCADAAAGKTRPVTEVFDCRMVGSWPTTKGAMKKFVASMTAAELERGILSVSLGHGYAWGDVADVGAKLWVVADGERALARSVADRLGRAFYEMRVETLAVNTPLDRAVEQVGSASELPVVMADFADNPGGGAPSDSTFVLAALIEAGVRDVAVGAIWDPFAVSICHSAGVGAKLHLRLGGKVSESSGQPLDLTVTVRAVSADHGQTGLMNSRETMGACAWVHAAGIDILLSSLRVQMFSTDAFTGLGIDLAAKRAIVVKSSQHFYASFSKIAASVIYVQTPGCLRPIESIRYTKRDQNYWPLVYDPLQFEGTTT